MNYGTALPSKFEIPKSAFWLRKDLEEKNPFEAITIHPGDIIMDCGAYIGTFSAAALEQGAAKAICYEAAPKNFALLARNMAPYGSRALLLPKALVPGDDKTITLNLSGFSGANSIIPAKNRSKSVEVPASCFRQKLARFRPQVLKIDIEGAEYAILATLRPGDLKSVRQIFIEFHPYQDREHQIASITKFLAREKFKIISDRKRAFIASK